MKAYGLARNYNATDDYSKKHNPVAHRRTTIRKAQKMTRRMARRIAKHQLKVNGE